MNVMMISFVTLLVVIAAGFYAIVLFNGLVYLRNQMDKGWANIDVLLKQRHDLVPNFVETVKGYAAHERKTFEAVTTARSAAATVLPQGRGSAPMVAQAEQVLGGTLRSLLAVAEAYPELKANENFLSLQDTLVGIENQIAERREFFNDAVNLYNNAIQRLPDVFVARALGYQRATYFTAAAADRAPVAVQFDSASAGS
ncbi:MAG TPA: LemA family protein [Verrucomicrobiae bacterium]|nr:LemA family protein [Verrucomicrobiae bacterium]